MIISWPGRISSKLNFNPLSANLTKWANTLKQFVGNLPTKCLSVFDYFVKLALKGLSLLLFITVLEELSLEIRSGCPEELFMLMIWQYLL